MISKNKSLIFKLISNYKKLINNKYFKLFLIVSNLCLFISLFHLNEKSLLYLQIPLTLSTIIFLGTSSRIKNNALLVDHGIMARPFNGLPIDAFLKGPVNRIGNNELKMAPVSLVTWLFFCVSIINQSDKNKFNYHQELVETINEQCPELISWLPEMYNYFYAEPPVPNDFSVEDFLK